MEDKKVIYKKISMTTLFLLLTCIMMACSSHKTDDTYKIMITNGVGYNVVGETITEVSRGSSARFEIDIEEGYKYVGSNFGEIENGFLVVRDIKRDMNVELFCRRFFDINSKVSNGLISVLPTEDAFYENSKVTVLVEPLPNYYLDKIIVNETEKAFEVDSDGKSRFELTVDQNLNIEAICLGDQYTFTLEISGLGALKIEDNEFDTSNSVIIHYGTTVNIKMIPSENGKVSWINLDGVVSIPKSDILKIDVNNDVNLKVSFDGENDVVILYDENGGSVVKDISSLTYQKNDYVYLDNCYEKLERKGYVLTGFNTKADGSGESYNLGAMFKIRENMIFYAEWAKESNASHFEFILDNDEYYVSGYSMLGLEANETTLVIPKKHADKDVVGILAGALSNNENIKEIILSASIRYVYENAFSNCVNLERIVITENMKSFESSSLNGNNNLKTVRYNETSSPILDNSFGRLAMYIADLAVTGRKPRYILISGSSGQFGIDHLLFNEKMDKEILVFGLNVSFYMESLLGLLSFYTIPGDVIIFSPEYMNVGYYVHSSNFNFNLSTWLRNTLLIEKLDFQADKPELHRIFDNINNLKQLITPQQEPINEYGVRYSYRENRGNEVEFPWEQLSLSPSLVNKVTKIYIIQMKERLEKTGAKLYFSFPPVSSKAFIVRNIDENKKNDFLEQLYLEYVGIDIISMLEDYVFDNLYFYDTIYHLSSEGATMRTEQLIKDIKAQLAKENAANDK